MANHQHPIPLMEPITWPDDPQFRWTKTTHFKVAWNGRAKCKSHSFQLLYFDDLHSYEYGAQKLLPGLARPSGTASLSIRKPETGEHLFSSSACNSCRLSFSSVIQFYYEGTDWKFSCQIQGHTGLAESRRAALLVSLQSPILLIPAAATQTKQTEKCLLPKVVQGAGSLSC